MRKQNSNKRKLNSAEQKDHWLRAIDLLFTSLFKLTSSGSLQSDLASNLTTRPRELFFIGNACPYIAELCGLLRFEEHICGGIRRVF